MDSCRIDTKGAILYTSGLLTVLEDPDAINAPINRVILISLLCDLAEMIPSDVGAKIREAAAAIRM